MKSATRATGSSPGYEEPEEPEQTGKMELMDYVEVGVAAQIRIGECTDGEGIFLLIDGRKKDAYLAHSMLKQEPESGGPK